MFRNSNFLIALLSPDNLLKHFLTARSASQQSGMSEPAEPNEGVASYVVSLDDTREAEENVTGSRNTLDVAHINSPDHAVDDDVNDFEDSEDEVDFAQVNEPSRSAVIRRRMVLDVEDDV